MGGGIITKGYGVKIYPAGLGPAPIITNYQLDVYSGLTSDIFNAQCDVSENPTFVAAIINDKFFQMTLDTGTTYKATILGMQIGLLTAGEVKYIAINGNGGSIETDANTITITMGALNIQEQIYENVIITLANAMQAGNDLDYIQIIAQGNLDDNLTSQKPWIIVSPTAIPEQYKTMPHGREMAIAIEIRGVIDCAKDSPVVSSNDGYGILKFDADIKNVLENDLTLSGAAYTLDVQTEQLKNIGGNSWETVIILTAKKRFNTGGR